MRHVIQETHKMRRVKRTLVIFVFLLQYLLLLSFVFNNILQFSVGSSYITRYLDHNNGGYYDFQHACSTIPRKMYRM